MGLADMKIILDSDLAKVVEFMLRNVEARRLRLVAIAIAQLANLCWTPESLDGGGKNRLFNLEVFDLDAIERSSVPASSLAANSQAGLPSR
jgi:hypothetical protein